MGVAVVPEDGFEPRLGLQRRPTSILGSQPTLGDRAGEIVNKTACLPLLIVLAATQAPADEVAVPARNLAGRSENVAPEYPQYGNLTLCVGEKGWMAWAIGVEGGPHYLHFLYCSGEPRPCQLSVNYKPHPGEVLAEPTGGFMPTDLVWKTYGPFDLIAGRNVIRIATNGLMPHLKGLAVSTDRHPPPESVFAHPLEQVTPEHLRSRLAACRKAVLHLHERYREAYPRAEGYLAEIGALETQLDRDDANHGRAPAELEGRVEQLRRRALVTDHPLLECSKLLFVKRHTYQSSHYYTDYIDGCDHFGGNLCALSLADGQVTALVPELNGGIFGRFDLSFDGRRIVFDYKPRQETGFRIWEVGVDGQGLRQITFDPPDEQERIEKYRHVELKEYAGREVVYNHHTDDMHPCYLPDGRIAFISTRCERGILCDGTDLYTTTTLYCVDADGKNMEVLSDSPLSEAFPSVMNDGRLLYTRWEYVDKADVVIKCLWAMRPDGTGSVEIFGNDITFPDGMLQGRAVPGRHNLFTVVGAPHMPAGAGTVIRLDVNRPIRTREPMTYITPEVDVRAEYGWYHRRGDGWLSDTRGPLFTDVRPLDDKFFLASANLDREYNDPTGWGLYLLDEFGDCVLIHREAETSCWQPVPLAPRKRPPVLPSLAAPNAKQPDAKRPEAAQAPRPATVTMSDVYAGLDGVERGTIKYLRVMETLPRPWAARHSWDGDTRYQQHAVVSMNTHLHVKRLHGIVPVEEDGSAHFRVPADKNIFFQALDADFMEVQRMRTFVNFRPGERRSCIGCHEMRRWAPGAKPVLALRHPPHDPAPQPGETAPRPIYYPTDVQPILDRYCLACHNAEKPDGDLDLSGELTELFSRSYENLVGKQKGLVAVCRENDPKTGDAAPIPPYTLGSHASRLIRLIREGHEDVKLSREDLITLVTWVDANAPYYGSYFGRRNLKYQDHPDFRPAPTIGSR